MDDSNTENKDSTQESDEGKTSAPSQKSKYTEKEQAAFSLKKNAERLRELGGDPIEVLDTKQKLQIDEALPDDKPLTVKDLRDIQKQDARNTAQQLASEITDEDEREKVLSELKWIVPSGDPEADLRRARGAVNTERNSKIAIEAGRRGDVRRTASGSSQNASSEDLFEPTAEEERMMRPPYRLTKEKIIEARKKSGQ